MKAKILGVGGLWLIYQFKNYILKDVALRLPRFRGFADAYFWHHSYHPLFFQYMNASFHSYSSKNIFVSTSIYNIHIRSQSLIKILGKFQKHPTPNKPLSNTHRPHWRWCWSPRKGCSLHGSAADVRLPWCKALPRARCVGVNAMIRLLFDSAYDDESLKAKCMLYISTIFF